MRAVSDQLDDSDTLCGDGFTASTFTSKVPYPNRLPRLITSVEAYQKLVRFRLASSFEPRKTVLTA